MQPCVCLRRAPVMPLTRRWRGLVVLLAALICVAMAVRLGMWQLGRAAQKEILQASLDLRSSLPDIDVTLLARTLEEAQSQHFRTVTLRGHWLHERTVFLDNRQMKARTGFYVVTPLRLEDGESAVLVQRGWAPRDFQDRTRLPKVPTPEGLVTVRGRIAPPPSRLYELDGEEGGPIRQNLDLGAFSREIGVGLRPLSVLMKDPPEAVGDGLLREWPLPAVDVHKHYGYAFQLFALGALMTGLYVWFQLVRPRLRGRT